MFRLFHYPFAEFAVARRMHLLVRSADAHLRDLRAVSNKGCVVNAT
jgi:hypothetical protein